jgi:Delta24-sterol reductase
MERIYSHQARVLALKQEIANWQAKQSQSSSPLCLSLKKQRSNTTNKKNYKQTKATLNISSLCNILDIDTSKKCALVEPKVTMYELAKKTYPLGFIPLVVPEFKSITVGGAIIGGAYESSAHKYGIFNDSCASYQILLGNGEVVKASPTENSDLFYGIAGSYGAFGTIVQAEIKLIEAPKAIKLTYIPFNDAKKALDYIKERSLGHSSTEYLDGILFSKNLAVIMEGSFASQDEVKHESSFSNIASLTAPWFYQHASSIAKEGRIHEEYIKPLDYLFRYDQGAFWMGSYLLKPALFMRLLYDGLWKASSKTTLPPFNEKEIKGFSQIQGKPPLLQKILGPLMSSQRLYALLHKVEKWAESKAIIQDFCIPFHAAESYLTTIQEASGIYPLWLCPIKKAANEQIFSPHSTNVNDTSYINFGIYGLANRSISPLVITRTLEQEATKLKGRKLLYSYTYYPEDEFWQIYPKQAYEDLRKKYHAENTWLSIEQKML